MTQPGQLHSEAEMREQLILESIKLLWKSTTPKRIHVPSIERGVYQLSLALCGNGETLACSGQIPSKGRRETQDDSIPSPGSTTAICVIGPEFQMPKAARRSPPTVDPFSP